MREEVSTGAARRPERMEEEGERLTKMGYLKSRCIGAVDCKKALGCCGVGGRGREFDVKKVAQWLSEMTGMQQTSLKRGTLLLTTPKR